MWADEETSAHIMYKKAADYDLLDEDLTAIPYGFADEWDIYFDADYDDYMIYLNSGNAATWSRFGMQSAYEVDGNVYESDICWYDINAISTVKGALLNGKKLATYYNSFEDITLPKGTQIYTATLADDNQGLVLHPAEGTLIPANNAVVLSTTEDVIYGIEKVKATTETILNEDNVLIGTDYAWSSFYDTAWLLGEEEGIAGFYEYDKPYLPTNSAYVPSYTATAGQGLPLQVESDGITAVRTSARTSSGAVYNLAGQRVNSQYKGLTIENGRKVIRK